MNEDKLLSIGQASVECSCDYEIEMIQKTEWVMLVLLDFKMNLPTPMDFLQFLLYMTDSSFDFSEIINECLSSIYVCLMGK